MLSRRSMSTQPPRSLEEITRLIEVYPPEWRRWCSSPEEWLGCACVGCVRQPAPSTVSGDPEYRPWPNEDDALTEQEVTIYLGAQA
jgi:hypothetical protein